MCVVVMAMVGWVGSGMEVVDGMHAGQSQVGWSHVKRCWSTSRVQSDKLMTPTSRCATPGMVSLPGKGRHVKALFCCP